MCLSVFCRSGTAFDFHKTMDYMFLVGEWILLAKHLSTSIVKLQLLYRAVFLLRKLSKVFEAYHGIAPLYISDMITKHEPTRSLRFSSKRLLVVLRYNLKTYGRRAFSVNGSILWNSLPDNIRETESLSTFKKHIKTFLFKRSFYYC